MCVGLTIKSQSMKFSYAKDGKAKSGDPRLDSPEDTRLIKDLVKHAVDVTSQAHINCMGKYEAALDHDFLATVVANSSLATAAHLISAAIDLHTKLTETSMAEAKAIYVELLMDMIDDQLKARAQAAVKKS